MVDSLLANFSKPLQLQGNRGEEEVRICEPGGRGLLFPLTEAEQEWNGIARAILYAMALIYLFLGVNIVADKFVNSIEAITSKKRRVLEKGSGRWVTVSVWNSTVSNLTLLALGSSAPEILLSIVEAGRNEFFCGDLGPATIVGSAAFNLFVIIAVCIMAIPSTEIRTIKENTVFAVTAVFSLVAYGWLVFIVQISSPDVVEIWEAVMTLVFLPVLVWVSYSADVGLWPFKKEPQIRAKLEPEPLPRMQDVVFKDYATSFRDAKDAGPQPQPGGGVAAFLDVGGSHELRGEDGKPLHNAAGVLSFAEDAKLVSAGFERKTITVTVYRKNGAEGNVQCKYHTEPMTAVPGYDYIHADGELTFADGQKYTQADIELLPKRLGEHSDQFQLVLEEVSGGAIFNPCSDGGEERCVLTVTILNENDKMAEQSVALRAGRVLDGCLNMDNLRRGRTDWSSEILSSICDMGNEDEPPTLVDFVVHVISLPWKLSVAVLVPPTAFLGGWLCFFLSLVVIGGLTAIIIDFAELFGCVTGIEDSITAITFVALGTSMPDLFASITAAKADSTADASIVNVTGSNSVNVFVGIGIPWTLASVYWQVTGANEDWLERYSQVYPDKVGSFIVPGGDLAFGVVVFTIAALMALVLLRLRRVKLGGELGGPFVPKVMSSMMLALLWLFYICLYIWKVISKDDDFWSQVSAIFIALMVVENLLLGAALCFYAFNSSEAEGKLGESPDSDHALPLPPPLTPPCGSGATAARAGHPSAYFATPASSSSSPRQPSVSQDLKDLRQVSHAGGHHGGPKPFQVSGPMQDFEAGVMSGSPMLTTRNLGPIVSVEALAREANLEGGWRSPCSSPTCEAAISFSSAAMVCLAANRLKRPLQFRADARRKEAARAPQRPVGLPHSVPPVLQRPAGLPPACPSGDGDLLPPVLMPAAPPAPAESPIALTRSGSFYSVDSGRSSGQNRSFSPAPRATTPLGQQGLSSIAATAASHTCTNSNGGPVYAMSSTASAACQSTVSAVQTVGGRVAGWVGEHQVDGVALCVAGLAAAQLAHH